MITPEQALTADRFTHVSLLNADKTPLRARRNGRTKTWKREPGRFRIPCKHGMWDYFYIDNSNAKEWNVA